MDRYDTTADVVWESFTEAEFSEAASIATTQHPGLRGTHRRSHLINLPPLVRAKYMDILRTREHEWTHFRQHVSTPYGVFHHRLLGMQELALQMFIRENPGHRGPLNIVIAESIAAGSHLPGSLGLWLCARQLAGALWSSNPTMKQLISLWEARNQWSTDSAWFGRPGPLRELTTNRSVDAEAVPNGVVSCEALVEGFAAYREIMELAVHFPRDDFAGHVAHHQSPEAKLATSFLEEMLGLAFGHPLSGALQELAILGFVEPVMAGPGNPLVWETICPSARFENAVRELARMGPPYPDRQADAYSLARKVMHIDESPDFLGQWQPVEAAAAVPASDAPTGVTLPELAARCEALQKERFVRALMLRAECPIVYFAPQVVVPSRPDIWNQFVDVGTPPIVVGPDGVGTQRVSESDGIALIVAAVAAYAMDDLARYGRFAITVQFLRRLARQENPWQELVHLLFEQMFAEGYHSELRTQVGEAFSG